MVSSPHSDPVRPRLQQGRLAELGEHIMRPRYDRGLVSPGIVHIGLGAFARAHLAAFTEDTLAAGANDWGICGVNLNSSAVEDALKPQDGLFTLLVRGPEGARPQVIGSVLDVLTAARDRRAVLDALVSPSTRIVSLTITEKGYCLNAANGTLDESHPLIAADLANPESPRSAAGFLVEALRLRREAGIAPFSVLSCDNLAHNGAKTRAAVAGLAALRNAKLGQFIRESVAFPSTMVDRITPATRDSDRIEVAAMLGLQDEAPVVAEPFRQWVIEDRFSQGRPPWEIAGALLVDDVEPYELMKLRCLNGAHSTLAYLGVVAGIETISEAMSTPGFAPLLRLLWRADVLPTLRPVGGVDLADYVRALESRFNNSEIRHQVLQISADGSQKLPQRLVAPALEQLRAGADLKVIPLAIAAWSRFLLGTAESGADYDVVDPLARQLRDTARRHAQSPGTMVDALLGIRSIFPAGLAEFPSFPEAVSKALDKIQQQGIRAAVLATVAAL